MDANCDIFISRKLLSKIVEQYGEMASIVLYSDGSGHINGGDGNRILRFYTIDELEKELEK